MAWPSPFFCFSFPPHLRYDCGRRYPARALRASGRRRSRQHQGRKIRKFRGNMSRIRSTASQSVAVGSASTVSLPL